MTYTAADLEAISTSSPYEETRESSDSSGYLRTSEMKEGVTTKFRILTPKSLNYWTTWTKNPDEEKPKPARTPEKPNPLPKNINYSFDKPDVFYFDCFVIWNYELKRYQIFEFKQIPIRKRLEEYAIDPDYGNFINYDISISKKGQGISTEYSIKTPPMFDPKTKDLVKNTMTQEELLEKMNYVKNNIHLPALFTGSDPFEGQTAETEDFKKWDVKKGPESPQTTDDLPF